MKVDGKPIVCLKMQDLQEGYSVQTPEIARAFFNVFYKKLDLETLLWRVEQALSPIFSRTGIPLKSFIRDEERKAEGKRREASWSGSEDARQESLRKVLERMETPGAYLFFSPPFYPAVHQPLWKSPVLQRALQNALQDTQAQTGQAFRISSYYPHISDLSFIQPSSGVWRTFQRHCPLFLPPPPVLSHQPIVTLDIGPYGKDPHQWSERVDTRYSLQILPILYQKMIQHFAKE